MEQNENTLHVSLKQHSGCGTSTQIKAQSKSYKVSLKLPFEEEKVYHSYAT
jgi:hypothetical protein